MGGQRLGTWVVAVSGGIDSMVLLDLVHKNADRRIVVAHVDHGIRDDSHLDAKFVGDIAAQKGLIFATTRLDLRGKTDEATARKYRYKWLDRVRKAYDASAVLTAHHQDDVIETMLINLRRGTGWRGLASLRSSGTVRRPLLDKTKADISQYAIHHGLEWREDSTNEDSRYTRNAIRHTVIPRLSTEERQKLVDIYTRQSNLRDQLEVELAAIYEMAKTKKGISRYWLTMVDHGVALELLQRHLGVRLERPRAEHLLVFARSAHDGATHILPGGRKARVTSEELIS